MSQHFPNPIFVDGHEVKVEMEMMDKNSLGYPTTGRYKDGRITLSSEVPLSVHRSTLLHEVLHHIWERSGLKRRFSEKTEETVLASIDEWLLLVLRDNPELVSYLTGGDY